MGITEIKKQLLEAVKNKQQKQARQLGKEILNSTENGEILQIAIINEFYELMEEVFNKETEFSKDYAKLESLLGSKIKKMEKLVVNHPTDAIFTSMALGHIKFLATELSAKYCMFDKKGPGVQFQTCAITCATIYKVAYDNGAKEKYDEFWQKWGEYCYHFTHGVANKMLKGEYGLRDYACLYSDTAKKKINDALPDLDIRNLGLLARTKNKYSYVVLDKLKEVFDVDSYKDVCNIEDFVNYNKKVFKGEPIYTIALLDKLFGNYYLTEFSAEVAFRAKEEGEVIIRDGNGLLSLVDVTVNHLAESFEKYHKEDCTPVVAYMMGNLVIMYLKLLDRLTSLSADYANDVIKIAPYVQKFLEKASYDDANDFIDNYGETTYFAYFGEMYRQYFHHEFVKIDSVPEEIKKEFKEKFASQIEQEENFYAQMSNDEEYIAFQKETDERLAVCKKVRNINFANMFKESEEGPKKKTTTKKTYTRSSSASRSYKPAKYVDYDARKRLKISLVITIIGLVCVGLLALFMYGKNIIPQFVKIAKGRTTQQLLQEYRPQFLGSGLVVVSGILGMATCKWRVVNIIFTVLSVVGILLALA